MGTGGIGFSVGDVLEVSVRCYIGGYGLCCSGAFLVIKISANFSTEVLALGPYSKKGVVGPGLRRILMRSWIASVALSCDDRAGIANLLGNNWEVS